MTVLPSKLFVYGCLFLIGLTLLFWISCRNSPGKKTISTLENEDTVYPNWKGGVIKHFGLYHFPKKGLKLLIQKNNDLLEFQLKNKWGKILLRSPKNMTVYESWAIFLDPKNNFWLHSTDIGDYEWVQNKRSYTCIELKEDLDTSKDVPDEFRDEVSSLGN